MSIFRKKPPQILFDAQKCERRTALAARRPGVEAAPVRLFKSAPAIGGKGLWDSRGILPATTSEALVLINRNLAPGSAPLTTKDVYIHYLEAANTGLIADRFMSLDSSTLLNVCDHAASGFAFMNSHRTGGISAPAELPYGRTFAGRYEAFTDAAGKAGWRALLGVYMLRGQHPNGSAGPSTDDLHRAIEGGTLSDVSLGLVGGTSRCDVCLLELGDKECGHAPGTHRQMGPEQIRSQEAKGVKAGKASYTLEGARPAEVSAVFKGAVPGAGFRKAHALAKAGGLDPREADEAKEAYVSLGWGMDLAPKGGSGVTLRKLVEFWQAAGQPEDVDMDLDLAELVSPAPASPTEDLAKAQLRAQSAEAESGRLRARLGPIEAERRKADDATARRLKQVRLLAASGMGREALADKGIHLDATAATMTAGQLEALLRLSPAGRDALVRPIF